MWIVGTFVIMQFVPTKVDLVTISRISFILLPSESFDVRLRICPLTAK